MLAVRVHRPMSLVREVQPLAWRDLNCRPREPELTGALNYCLMTG